MPQEIELMPLKSATKKDALSDDEGDVKVTSMSEDSVKQLKASDTTEMDDILEEVKL